MNSVFVTGLLNGFILVTSRRQPINASPSTVFRSRSMPMAIDLYDLLTAYAVQRIQEVYISIQTAVESYAHIVLNTMTDRTSALSSAAAMKVSQTRRMACTHLTMGRYYGEQRCPICRRDPDLGYTYLCTQDESECLSFECLSNKMEVEHAEATAVDDGLQTFQGKLGPYTRLSPWIEKAIANGDYTSEQIAILTAQKQKVNATIAEALSESKERGSGYTKTATRSSVDIISYQPFPVINEVNDASTASPPNPKGMAEARIFPYCEFRACQTCRPTFRDRAWQQFEDILTGPDAPAIDFANDNRPLSNPYIIAGIGSREPMTRPQLRTFSSFSLYQPNIPAKRNLTNSATRYGGIADQRPEPESTGFRDSVKRAFRGMRLSRRDSISSKRSNRSSRLTSRKMRVQEEESSGDRVDFNMLNDEILHTASNVKLPGHDGMDGLEDQTKEVEVGDGVAVTEEAVDTGTADVIMHV